MPKLIPSYSAQNFKYKNLNTNNTYSSSINKSKTRLNNYDSINKYNNVPKLSYINIVKKKFKSPENKNRLFKIIKQS